jgi:hypothetical protein
LSGRAWYPSEEKREPMTVDVKTAIAAIGNH